MRPRRLASRGDATADHAVGHRVVEAYAPGRVVGVTGEGDLTDPGQARPLHWTPDGLPVGVQFAGRIDDEATLLRLATQLEAARPWFVRRPPLVTQAHSPPASVPESKVVEVPGRGGALVGSADHQQGALVGGVGVSTLAGEPDST